MHNTSDYIGKCFFLISHPYTLGFNVLLKVSLTQPYITRQEHQYWMILQNHITFSMSSSKVLLLASCYVDAWSLKSCQGWVKDIMANIPWLNYGWVTNTWLSKGKDKAMTTVKQHKH